MIMMSLTKSNKTVVKFIVQILVLTAVSLTIAYFLN